MDGIVKRSIPARAGETAKDTDGVGAVAVYPRTGGGNGPGGTIRFTPRGLSPHGRGKPVFFLCPAAGRGSIPARAGETVLEGILRAQDAVYPRTGGGNPSAGGIGWCDRGLSPHGRGKPNGRIAA